MTTFKYMIAILLAAQLFCIYSFAQPPLPGPPDNMNWAGILTQNARGPIQNGSSASAVAPNGLDVYIAGVVPVGAENAIKVAHWNGSDWTFLGSHLVRPSIQTSAWSLAVDSDDNVYVGGNFTLAFNSQSDSIYSPGIAKWDAALQQWMAVGQGTDVGATDIAIDTNDDLYVSGPIHGYDPDGTTVPLYGVGRWITDPANPHWEPMGGGVDQIVNSVAVSDSGVFCGGNLIFAYNDNAPPTAAFGIAHWNVNTGEWSSLKDGLLSGNYGQIWVQDMAVDINGQLYLTGDIGGGNNGNGNTIPGKTVHWDGQQWNDFSTGIASNDFMLQVQTNALGDIYALHVDFQTYASIVSKWAGTQWEEFAFLGGESFNNIAAHKSALLTEIYAGGNFNSVTRADTGVEHDIQSNAIYSLGAWQGMIGQGANGSNGGVYAWSSLAAGIDNGYRPEYLYVGGEFTEVGGVAANNIARYNGNSWEPMGGGLNGPVYTIHHYFNGTVAVGGAFTKATQSSGWQVDANGVAIWDIASQSWLTNAAGGGVNGIVYGISHEWLVTLGIFAGTVTVVGDFDAVYDSDGNAIPARGIGFYNWGEDEWIDVGRVAGGQAVVYELRGNYIGGDFESIIDADGTVIPANNIAYADFWGLFDIDWYPIGQGTNGPVYTIEGIPILGGDHIFVGGDFSEVADGYATYNVGNMSSYYRPAGEDGWWAPIVGGLNGPVYSLEAMPFSDYGGLWVGGEFDRIVYENGNQRVADNLAVYAVTPGHHTVPFWNTRGDGSDGPVHSMIALPGCYGDIGELVYIGGQFSSVGLNQAENMARWRYRWKYRAHVSHSASSGSGSSSGGVTGYVTTRFTTNCGDIYEGEEDILLFKNLAYGEGITLDSVPAFSWFDLTLELADDPAVSVTMDSLLLNNQGAALINVQGIMDDTTLYAQNPDGRSIAAAVGFYTLPAYKVTDDSVQVLFVHSVTDAPMLRVENSAGDILAEGLKYGDASGVFGMLPAEYTFNIVRESDNQVVGEFNANLSENAGTIVSLALTGFMDPAANQNGPELALNLHDTGIEEPLTDIEPLLEQQRPLSFEIKQNYPNPFNPSTTIEFTVPVGYLQEIKVAIHNVLGQHISTLSEGVFPSGSRQVTWDGTNDAGQPVASGVYFYSISGRDYVETRKMILAR